MTHFQATILNLLLLKDKVRILPRILPRVFCNTQRIVVAGEVLAQSDGVSFRVDSSGRRATVLVTASTLHIIGGHFGAELQAVYGNFVDAQNQTVFEVSQTESTASCAKLDSWTSERYNPISDTLSKWTQILIIPRSVFFSPLDDGMSATFVALIFGCATVLVLNVHIPSVHVEDDATSSASSKGDETESSNSSCELSELSNVFAAHKVSGGQEGGSCAVGEEDPVVLMSQDPESMSSDLKGDVSNYQRLYRFAWLQLQPTVTALKADPDKADCKLIERAAEYTNLAVDGFFVYTLVMTEQRYGCDSVQSKLFRWLNGSWAFGLRRVFTCLFILAAFLPTNSTEQRVLDIVVLTVISCFTAAWALYQWIQLKGGGLRALMWVHINFLGLAWFALILQELGVVSVLGCMRPWALLLSSETLQGTLMVLVICVCDISIILAFAFFSICASGAVFLRLYKDRLDEGATPINTFLDSFMTTFVFMESADNWESLVYNAYKVSKAGAIVLFAVAIFGAFFLVALATLRVTT